MLLLQGSADSQSAFTVGWGGENGDVGGNRSGTIISNFRVRSFRLLLLLLLWWLLLVSLIFVCCVLILTIAEHPTFLSLMLDKFVRQDLFHKEFFQTKNLAKLQWTLLYQQLH